jgi:hypothetical protein
MNNASRTVLMIGTAVLAGGLLEGTSQAQAPANPTPLYPSAEWPTCIANAPTDCHLPDGHPDLTGLWTANAPSVGGGGGALASGATEQVFAGRGNSFVGFEADGGLFRETQVAVGNGQPQYKPQFWDEIIDHEYNGNFEDPAQDCLPNGIPRAGAPAAILSPPNQPWVVLIYSGADSAGLKLRMIPTDGRPHNLVNISAETWDGDPVGHWENDTLVIESVGFTDASWLAKSGFVHGFNMRVTERFTRTGNSLAYQATVEDPDYFTKPWVQDAVTRTVVTDPNATLYAPLPCNDIDHLHVTAHVRSG